jgi:hypothetical protein
MKLLFMNFEWNAQMWIGWIISGLVIVVISISLAYVTKRQSFGVGEHNAIRAGTFAWYLFGTMVSQGIGFFACIIFGYTGDSYYQFFCCFSTHKETTVAFANLHRNFSLRRGV